MSKSIFYDLTKPVLDHWVMLVWERWMSRFPAHVFRNTENSRNVPPYRQAHTMPARLARGVIDMIARARGNAHERMSYWQNVNGAIHLSPDKKARRANCRPAITGSIKANYPFVSSTDLSTPISAGGPSQARTQRLVQISILCSHIVR